MLARISHVAHRSPRVTVHFLACGISLACAFGVLRVKGARDAKVGSFNFLARRWMEGKRSGVMKSATENENVSSYPKIERV